MAGARILHFGDADFFALCSDRTCEGPIVQRAHRGGWARVRVRV